jgi:cell division protein FtsA
MMGSQIVVGLDVGTTKVCAIAAEINGKGMRLLGMGNSDSTGIRKGLIINIDATVGAIKQAIAECEKFSGTKIRSVIVGVSGNHIQGFNSSGLVGVRKREVSFSDVDNAIDSAKTVHIPLDREILHVIPIEFVLDEHEGIADPIGMSGVRLEARVHIVTGAVSPVQNLIKCCEKSGLAVSDVVLEPLASANATLTQEEKEFGVVLVDIGGGTTDIALFKDGCLRHVSVLGIGGAHLTNDIAIGLRISMYEAERLKKSYGAAVTGIIADDSEEIQIKHTGDKERVIPRKYLAEILQPRCDEMLEIIKGAIKESYGYELATCGVVLTGGCALLEGLDKMAEAVLGLPVRIGTPSSVTGMNARMANPMYATGVGLISFNKTSMSNRIFLPEVFSGVFGIMKDWVKGVIQ